MLTLSVGEAYLGAFFSSNFAIPGTPDAYGQYVIYSTLSDSFTIADHSKRIS